MAPCIRSRTNALVLVLLLVAYVVVLKTLLLKTGKKAILTPGPQRVRLQRCVHDPVPCPRIEYADRNEHSLIDLNNFTYLLDAEPCSGHESLLVLIHSAVDHFTERDSVRTTWGAGTGWLKNLTLKVVFLLGETDRPTLQDLIAHENRRHRDTVQGNFVDSYHNLTYKHVMGLRWATTRCSRVGKVLKMDDDIFVHIFHLDRILSSSVLDKRRSIACYVQKQMPVSRSQGGKWQVDEADYPGSFFEDYCSGWAYIADLASIRGMLRESRYRPYFWVDDVHVTGTLARMAGVERVKMNRRFTTEADSLSLWARHPDAKFDWGFTFGPTWGDVDLVSRAHRKALWCRRYGCRCCFRVNDVAQKPDTPRGLAPLAGRAVIHRISP